MAEPDARCGLARPLREDDGLTCSGSCHPDNGVTMVIGYAEASAAH